ncbi:MAG: hypothetical protein ACRD0S_08835, partial [Acidimicrobiales bacterium]
MRVRPVAIVAGALAVAAWAAPAVAADVNNETLVSKAASVARTFDGPAAVVDPANDDNVVVASADLLANTCHIFRSANGGETFTELDGPTFGASTDCGLNKGGTPQN